MDKHIGYVMFWSFMKKQENGTEKNKPIKNNTNSIIF